MTRSQVLNTIATAEPGTRTMLDAIDAVNLAAWKGRGAAFIAEADSILAEREEEAVAAQAKRKAGGDSNTPLVGGHGPRVWPLPVGPKLWKDERAA